VHHSIPAAQVVSGDAQIERQAHQSARADTITARTQARQNWTWSGQGGTQEWSPVRSLNATNVFCLGAGRQREGWWRALMRCIDQKQEARRRKAQSESPWHVHELGLHRTNSVQSHSHSSATPRSNWAIHLCSEATSKCTHSRSHRYRSSLRALRSMTHVPYPRAADRKN